MLQAQLRAAWRTELVDEVHFLNAKKEQIDCQGRKHSSSCIRPFWILYAEGSLFGCQLADYRRVGLLGSEREVIRQVREELSVSVIALGGWIFELNMGFGGKFFNAGIALPAL
jgi:hypothetical protein